MLGDASGFVTKRIGLGSPFDEAESFVQPSRGRCYFVPNRQLHPLHTIDGAGMGDGRAQQRFAGAASSRLRSDPRSPQRHLVPILEMPAAHESDRADELRLSIECAENHRVRAAKELFAKSLRIERDVVIGRSGEGQRCIVQGPPSKCDVGVDVVAG